MHNELRRLTATPESWPQKFTPKITNTPALPAIDWAAAGFQSPVLKNTPSGIPEATAVVITWADAEWAAMQHVFCTFQQPMHYTARNTGSWPGWVKYTDELPKTQSNEGWSFWGEYRLVEIAGNPVLLFKSNTHLDFPGEQYLEQMINLLIQNVKPQVILSIGTAGGARPTDPIGTVNVVNAGTLYESGKGQSQWPTYATNWSPDFIKLGSAAFKNILFPIPAIASDISSLAAQFNQFYGTNYAVDVLNINNLNTGQGTPSINDLAPQAISLLTTDTFVVATSAGNLTAFSCVEMDDAIIAMVCKNNGVDFGAVRNVSDPVQNVALPAKVQGNWGSAIYTSYGIYTSYNGACAALAILS